MDKFVLNDLAANIQHLLAKAGLEVEIIYHPSREEAKYWIEIQLDDEEAASEWAKNPVEYTFKQVPIEQKATPPVYRQVLLTLRREPEGPTTLFIDLPNIGPMAKAPIRGATSEERVENVAQEIEVFIEDIAEVLVDEL